MAIIDLCFVSAAAMANTTSPANNQITSVLALKSSDILAAYSGAMYPDMPCPTQIFLEINQMTNLRVQLQKNSCGQHDGAVMASHILQRIDSFAPETWQEPYPLPATHLALLLARIYKASAALYGILTLSLHRRSNLASTSDGSAESYNIRRIRLRDYLVKLIGEGMQTLPSLTPLCWPLAVTGVALADGTTAEQTLVINYLHVICATPETYRGPVLLIPRLQQFWLSGMSNWEDCFNQPCTVLG